MPPSYFRGAHGIVIMYDITSRASFDKVRDSILSQVETNCSDNTSRILLANKSDLEGTDREVETAEGEALAQQNEMLFFEVSAKLGGDKIDEAFGTLLKEIIKNAISFEASGSSTMTRREAAPIKIRGAGDQNADVDKTTSCCTTTK